MSGIQMAVMGANTASSYSLVTGGAGSPGSFTRGFISGSIGSITPTAFTLSGGTAISSLYYDQGGFYSFIVVGGTNTGWTTLSVDGTLLLSRTSANSYSSGGGLSVWTWNTADTLATQIFGSAGTTHSVAIS